LVYLIIPVISVVAVPTTKAMASTTIEFFSLKQHQRVDITNEQGEDKFVLFIDTLKENHSTICIRLDGIIKNNSESNFIVDTSACIRITDTTLVPKEESTLNDLAFEFKILLLNGNKLQGPSILKPYEISTISLVAILDKKNFDKFLPQTPLSGVRHGNLILDYSFTDINQKGTSYSDRKTVEAFSVSKAGMGNTEILIRAAFSGQIDSTKLKGIIDTGYVNYLR
jgi:hypothetical protein